MKEDLKHMQEQEKEHMEQELESAKKRQAALTDLEKGVCICLNRGRLSWLKEFQGFPLASA